MRYLLYAIISLAIAQQGSAEDDGTGVIAAAASMKLSAIQKLTPLLGTDDPNPDVLWTITAKELSNVFVPKTTESDAKIFKNTLHLCASVPPPHESEK
jgi:hypothetical protein